MGYLFIFGTMLFTVYGQLIIKWQMQGAGKMPTGVVSKVYFFSHLLINPWVISSITAAFLALICWMAAMTKFELSYAYPFMSLSFALILLLSNIFFNEPFTFQKAIGVTLITLGVIIGSLK
jgi:multidrug transporter EmrE-like cation transporter